MIKNWFLIRFGLLFFAIVNLPAGQARAQSQDSLPKHQFSIQHDNDFIFSIDRYYTTGTFLGYGKSLAGDFIFKKTEGAALQLDFVLGQETYTPRELFKTDFNVLERPYAGYLFFSGAITRVKTSNLWELKAEIGLAGPQSLAGEAQVAYHKLINEFIPSWSGEIANSIHFNGYGSYVKSFQKESAVFFDIHSSAAFGTRQVFANQEATLFVGNRDAIRQSSFYNRIGAKNEFYGYAGLSFRVVSLNALIQGNPLGDDSPFTLPIVHYIGAAKAGVTLRRGCNTFQAEYVTQTKETSREGQLHYASFVFKRVF